MSTKLKQFQEQIFRSVSDASLEDKLCFHYQSISVAEDQLPLAKIRAEVAQMGLDVDDEGHVSADSSDSRSDDITEINQRFAKMWLKDIHHYHSLLNITQYEIGYSWSPSDLNKLPTYIYRQNLFEATRGKEC